MSQYATKYLATRPADTLYAGIDLSLDSLVVVVLNAQAERLDRFRSDHGAPGVLVGLEPTNSYWKQVGYHLERHAVPFRLVNAFTVKRHREGDRLNRSKDDWHDAHTIADLLRTGKFTQTRLPHGVYAEFQTGYSAYWRLCQDRGRPMTLLINTVRQLFPEVEEVFKDLSGETTHAVIRAGLCPQQIRTQSAAEYRAQVRAHCQSRRLSLKPIHHLHRLAATSQGFREATTALKLMAQHQAPTLARLDAQAAQWLETLLQRF